MSSSRLSIGPGPALNTARGHANEDSQQRAAAPVIASRSPHESAHQPVLQAKSVDTSVSSLGTHTEDSYTRQIAIPRENEQHVAHHSPANHDGWRSKPSESLKLYEYPIAAGYEAQAYIASELQHNDRLGAYERDILQVTIDSIPRCDEGKRVYLPELEECMSYDRGLYDPLMYPSEEVICFLSTGN